jgi:RimJ/RimL family protein N-acetyltransferase
VVLGKFKRSDFFKMNPKCQIELRHVLASDLPLFFEHQVDPVAVRMVGLPSRDHNAFYEHWSRIMQDKSIILRTILFEGQIAGYLTTFEREDVRQVGYWLGREFWGKGIATRALQLFLPIIPYRPLYGIATVENQASQKVLLKCGFKMVEELEGLRKFLFFS